LTFTQRRVDDTARNLFKKKNEGFQFPSLNDSNTNYSKQYGVSSQIFSQVLKPEIAYMIDHWLKINEVEEFRRRIYTTIREMYLSLKKKEPSPVIVGQELKWASLDSPLKAPKFDNMIDRQRLRRFDKSNPPFKKNEMIDQTIDSVEYESPRSNSPSPDKDGSGDPRFYLFAQKPIEAKKTKLKFLQGHYGKFTYFCDIPDDGVTSYKKQFPYKDKHPIDNWKNNYAKISFFSNNVSPEPKTLGKF
jgi:hypothetical protein